MKTNLNDKVLDSITEGVFTIDKNFIITSFNSAASNLVGISKNKAIGKKCFDVFHSSVCEKDCPLKKAIKSKKPVINNSIYFINSLGKKVPINVTATPMFNNNGKLIGGVETIRDITQIENLRKKISVKYDFNDIISKNSKMMELFAIMPDIAESDSNVVIEGKSGTGKELFARAMHSLSKRKDKPMIAVNCGALPDTLLESELFGYTAGAFTDARKDKQGRFDAAEGGTLFLDEIGNISPAMQVKLLRVLQEKEFTPLGSTNSKKANVRIITATNQALLSLVEKDIFRSDLYYRLNVVNLVIPSLSERKEDVPLLVDHFITKFNHLKNKNIEGISHEALSLLMQYRFQGNVRELENIIEHSFILCKAEHILPEHMPKNIIPHSELKYTIPSGKSLQEMEMQMIYAALERNKWKKVRAAKELKINKTTLWRKMQKYKIMKP